MSRTRKVSTESLGNDGLLFDPDNLTFSYYSHGTTTPVGSPAPMTGVLTDAATINWDVSSAVVAAVTLGGNRTVAAPTNLANGATYLLRVVQDGTGSRTLTWNSVFKWPGGTAPTLTATANAVDILSFVSDGVNLYGVAQWDFK